MTNKQKETVLAGFQAAAAGLRTDELPEWLLAKGRALPFYQKALTAGSADEAFLALYSAFPPARSVPCWPGSAGMTPTPPLQKKKAPPPPRRSWPSWKAASAACSSGSRKSIRQTKMKTGLL